MHRICSYFWRESAALAYYRPSESLQFKRPWKRAVTLYLVHILLFSLLVGISAAVKAADPANWADMRSFWQAPYRHGAEALALTYMPGNLDILPMYMVLLGLVPFVFWLHERSQAILLCLSCQVWFAAEVGARRPPLVFRPVFVAVSLCDRDRDWHENEAVGTCATLQSFSVLCSPFFLRWRPSQQTWPYILVM